MKKKGCELHDDCLTCPYPDCVRGTAKTTKLTKIKRTIELRQQGFTREQIAKELGRSLRTIHRYFLEIDRQSMEGDNGEVPKGT